MMRVSGGRAHWTLSWLRWRPPRLMFDDEQESRFINQRRGARLRHFLRSGAVALVIFNLFLLSDKMMVPDVFEQAMRLRLFVYSPLALCLIVMGWRCFDWFIARPAWIIELIAVSSGVLAAVTLCAVLVQTTSPWAVLYRGGFVPILIYSNVVQRFRFRMALVSTLVVLAVYAVSILAVSGQPLPYPDLEIPLALLVVVMASHTLVINYRLELEERRRFSRTERARELREQLRSSQAQLSAQSRQDALTGLPNRRAFDEAVAQQWLQHQQTRRVLAFALIDVDHFKDYNDRYGHLAGDQCLKLVAQALNERALALGGITARWGGEEFVVLWPDMDVPRARRFSDELVQAVRQLGLRHEASGTGDGVTISVGVALAKPAVPELRFEEVLAAADAALYRAKQAGRNRIELDTPV